MRVGPYILNQLRTEARDALAAGQLERLLPEWSFPLGAVYWVTPPGGPRPKRVEVLGDFLFEKLSLNTNRRARTAPKDALRPGTKGKALKS